MREKYDDGEGIVAVGKIEFEPKEKKKPTKTYSVPVAPRRAKKEKKDWSASDIGAEFSSRVTQRFPNYLGQANAVHCTKVFGRLMKSKGISSEEMIAAMDIFFEDDRNFNSVGDGIPIWLKFLRAFPHIQGRAKRVSGGEVFDWEEEANRV